MFRGSINNRWSGLFGKILLGLLFFSLLFFFSATRIFSAVPNLVINEILVSNVSNNRDSRFNNYSSWIEIYNKGTTTVNLTGYTLTDDLSQPDKWTINNKSIAPGAYALFWADDGNIGNDHTNFKLRHRGEDVGLFTPSGVLVDGFSFGEQVRNVSFGRKPDGSSNWVYFQEPTPKASNNTPDLPDTDQVGEPQFSQDGGFISNAFLLTITAPSPLALVTYTVDGSEPTESSPAANGSIEIDKTMVVRARSFESGVLDGDIVTNSYLFNEGTTLPVVSLVTDPGNFFDDEFGIYVIGTNGKLTTCADYEANFFQDWTRPVSLEFFETNGDPGFKFNGSVEIQGSCSRSYPIKALDISLDYKYGLNKINYDLFPGYDMNEFKAFLLRPSGQDQFKTMIKDGLAHMLLQDQMDIDSQAYRPSVVFINGAYWGIHNIREKLNDDYIETHHNEADIDLIKRVNAWIEVKNGDKNALLALEDYVRTHDLSDPNYYDYVAARVDINEFINYQLTRIYYATHDWPANNIRVWRPRQELGQWRWMAFDVDNDLRYPFRDTMAWATDPNAEYEWSTLFLRKLLENEGFRDEFLQRFASHMNITYDQNRVIGFIDSLQQNIAAEMPRHRQRWGAPSEATWESEIELTRVFARRRRDYMIDDMFNYFNLTGMDNLTINITGGGQVLANGVTVPSPAYSGPYFSEIPIRLEARPDAGYKFTGWQELGLSNAQTTVTLTSDLTITAVFEPADLPPEIVINEIHYNPSSIQGEDDDYEFLELFNNSGSSVDLSGFTFSDGFDFTFPASTSIADGEVILLAKNPATYSSLNCQIFQWAIDDNLSNGGEIVQLDNQYRIMVDFVEYDDGGDWPTAPDGDGPSLELVDPSLDNTLAASWDQSPAVGGSPCVMHSADDVTQEIYLSSGWNLISSYVAPNDPPLETVMAGIESNMILMKNGDGQVYWPAIPINGIGNWDIKDGYQINMSNAVTLTLTGQKVYPDLISIGLSTGWNTVSYLRDTALPVDQAMASISGSLKLLKNGEGALYWPEFGINQIGELHPGEGYQIYTNTAATLVYP